jgi:hypothetical protein
VWGVWGVWGVTRELWGERKYFSKLQLQTLILS